MKISLNWLKNFINIPKNQTEIEDVLTEVGLEVDQVIKIQPDKKYINNLIVGEIISISKHPNADRLNLAKVNVGNKKLSIICGAKNINIGQKVVVAKSGTKIKNVSGDILEIKKTKIRGIESDGMICAEDEIGIGNSHSGIIVLPISAKIGKAAINYLETFTDTIFDISLTPNRADAISHMGVARDLKAIFNKKISLPDISKFSSSNNLSIDVEIKNKNACPRYTGCIIENIEIKESPSYIKNHLASIGINPINNVVDITNYVLHSVGQPLHAFDYEKINKNKIIVQYARKNQKFISLDGIERKLNADDLMICDGDNKPMCIAGVFGGENSGVSESTKTIFLESAYFNPSDVRKSSQNHQLKTDASYRFERGVDPNITVYALKYASVLIAKYCNGIVSSKVYDLYPKKINENKIEFSYERIDSLIGKKIGNKKISDILNLLDINVTKKGNKYVASVPPYRVDVTREADLVEEILRIYGYNNIGTSSSNKSDYLSDESIASYENNVLSKVMNLLVGNGFYEITTNSLTSSRHRTDKSWNDLLTIEMINKLSDEHAILKQNLLFTGLETIRYNINRKQNNLKFFEFDKVYLKEKNSYKEIKKIGIYMTGLNNEEHFSNKTSYVKFYNVLNLINRLLIIANIKNCEIQESESKSLENCIKLLFKNNTICKIGKVNNNLLANYEIDQEVFFAEINWENYLKYFNREFSFSKIPKFPEVKRDLSIILSDNKKFSEIMGIIERNKKKIIKKVTLYDIYQGDIIGKNKVAYALRFILQDDDKTLEDKRINGTMKNLINSFEKDLGAEIRK